MSTETADEVTRLRDALSELLDDTQHSEHDCGDTDCPVTRAQAVLAGLPDESADSGDYPNVWDTDLTNDEIERLSIALANADYMNWGALGVATLIQGTVRAIAAARLTQPRAAATPALSTEETL